ncbi:replication initiator protein RctB domain-containing protein (plasmid) [Vibrio harveyi]|uniref:replication initiator protein RctB domain-containing protein n=1 Tax=Vibrio harveyi TaxID=669 RepID=UPI0031BA818F
MATLLNRDNNKSFYFVENKAEKISDRTWALFAKTKAQRKVLETIDQMHKSRRVGSVIEFEEIIEALGKKGDNYLRRIFSLEPLSLFIDYPDFQSQTTLPLTTKCVCLNYRLLSSDQSLDELLAQKEAQANNQPNTAQIVTEENKIARDEYGYEKGVIEAQNAFTTEALTSLISLVSNETDRTITKRVPSRKSDTPQYVTIRTANKRIVALNDIVGIVACAMLTHAYHVYRIPYYHSCKKQAPNETPISLSAIRKLLGRPRTSTVNNQIRETLDITRDTTFDFTEGFKYADRTMPRRRYFECDPVRSKDAQIASEEDAETAFYNANIFVLKWDEQIFKSIVDKSSLLVLPEGILKIEPVLAVLYLKLRAMQNLKPKKDSETAQHSFHPDKFLMDYLHLDASEFKKIIRRAYKNRAKLDDPSGYDIEDTTEGATLNVTLYGYQLNFDFENKYVHVVCHHDVMMSYLDLPAENDGAPTIPNILSLHMRSIIEEDIEVNSIRDTRYVFDSDTHTCVIRDEIENGIKFTVSAYTSDDKISLIATMMQDEDNERDKVTDRIHEVIAQCKPLTIEGEVLTEQQLNLLRNDIMCDMRMTSILDVDTIVRHLAKKPSDLGEVAAYIKHGIELPFSMMNEIAEM